VKLERIVIGIDFSAASIAAARWVAGQLAPGSELVLAHVIPIPGSPPATGSPRRDLLIDTVREEAEKKLREIGRKLNAEWVWREVRHGEPAGCLTSIAEEFSADVVVVGAHADRADGVEALGSTAERLVRTSVCPVLLVTRPGSTPPSRVLVPVDRSEGVAEALRCAGDISRRFGARVTALHVVPPGIASGALAAAPVVSGTPPVDVAAQRAFSESPQRWLERVVGAGVPSERAESEVAFGTVTPEILGVADHIGADLVVMGRPNAGNLRRAVFGSVVAGVLHDATCPVLVVPEALVRTGIESDRCPRLSDTQAAETRHSRAHHHRNLQASLTSE